MSEASVPAVVRRRDRLRGNRLVIRATKSLVGSVIATVCSEAAFALSYGTNLLGTTGASAVAFVAGAVPNYFLNRSWAWQRHGRVRVWREVVLYALVSVLSFVASALVTAWAAHASRHYTTDHLVKTLLVSAAYLATYAVLFGAKFAAYELVIFADPSRKPGR
jgi:putative flippase GtrA